ncbi:hypothetical protein HDC30_002416 [Pseudomonas sp. JAI115]|uniref:hypothetical protein n=1 Tax=Pseudomonas sp. JAI115 TaxID=2723061 RepID=UPI00160F9A56|nr:hypothetical protein [Pseudomonas sp. JAI115]MBB6155193.1 hypothetical protein [Pseudomonas sp. JAI115]
MGESALNANPFADWPLHHLLFVKLRNSAKGLAKAQSVADLHGLSLEELKAHCRLAGEELIVREGALTEAGQRIYDWASDVTELSVTAHQQGTHHAHD